MSRSGYNDDYDGDGFPLALYRENVDRAIRGRRGQVFLRDLVEALDALPEKRLISDDLVVSGWAETSDRIAPEYDFKFEYSGSWGRFGYDAPQRQGACAIGALGIRRGVDMSRLDPEQADRVAKAFGIAECLAREVVFENDEAGPRAETPEARWQRMRDWAVQHLKSDTAGVKS